MISSQLFLLFLLRLVLAAFQPEGIPFKAPVTTADGLSASVLFSNLTAPRGISFDSQQNILVVERGLGITVFSPAVNSVPGWERTIVVQNSHLTHGIQVDDNLLYASTAGEVLVYTYDSNTKAASAVPVTLISGLPADGELTTHTLQFERDSSGKPIAILVGSGPKTNIDLSARDPSSGRSQIRRFPLNTNTPSSLSGGGPLPWANGQVIAYGIRNPAGFAFPLGRSPFSPINIRTLIVVENGASIDNTTGITPAFANDNPSDEIERVIYTSTPSTNSQPFSHGFPDCTTLWNPTADPIGVPQYTNLPRGTQFSLHLDSTHDDAWCQDLGNNLPPVFNFQSHSVPLDITFYQPRPIYDAKGLPASWTRQAFVSFHGSFDRSPPTGYGVVRVPYPFSRPSTNNDTLGYFFLIQAADLGSCPGKCIRPVGLAFGMNNRLYVSSDSSGELFVIESKSPIGPTPI